jgi:membrane carboxypeptidase/penicillin-binding protein
MKKVLQGKNRVKFPVPEGIKFEKVDARSGTLPDEQSVETMNVALKEEVIIPPRVLELEKTQLGQASVNSTTTSELVDVVSNP